MAEGHVEPVIPIQEPADAHVELNNVPDGKAGAGGKKKRRERRPSQAPAEAAGDQEGSPAGGTQGAQAASLPDGGPPAEGPAEEPRANGLAKNAHQQASPPQSPAQSPAAARAAASPPADGAAAREAPAAAKTPPAGAVPLAGLVQASSKPPAAAAEAQAEAPAAEKAPPPPAANSPPPPAAHSPDGGPPSAAKEGGGGSSSAKRFPSAPKADAPSAAPKGSPSPKGPGPGPGPAAARPLRRASHGSGGSGRPGSAGPAEGGAGPDALPEALQLAQARRRRLSEGFVDPLERRAASTGAGGPAPPATASSPALTSVDIPRSPRPAHAQSGPPRQQYELKHVPGQDTLPYKQLKGMRPEDGVDMTRKELYLSPEEFLEIFKKDKEAFAKLPKWRQTLAKKDVGLF